MRTWIVLVGGVLAACGGTVVVDGPPEGGGGAGGDGGAGASGPGPSGPGPSGPGTTGPGQGPGPSGPGPSTTVGTGPGNDCDLGSDGCVGCGELITFNECVADQLCSRSLQIYKALFECVCTLCQGECSDNAQRPG